MEDNTNSRRDSRASNLANSSKDGMLVSNVLEPGVVRDVAQRLSRDVTVMGVFNFII